MSDTTDTTENKREDEHSDRAIDVSHLVPEWKLRGTRGDPLTDGTRTELNENVTMKIFGKLTNYDLRVDSFSFGDEQRTNWHVDSLDFGDLLIDVTVRCLTSRGRLACSAESGRSSHTSTARTLLQFEENDAVTTVFAYYNYLQYLTAENMECTAKYNTLRTMMIVTVPAYINYSRNRSEVVTQEQAKVLNEQLQNYDVSFFENLNYHKDEVRAVAAAAIMTTYRGTYAFNANTNNAGIGRGPTMKLFETDLRTDISSNSSISRILGMVEWQIAHYKKQKNDPKTKNTLFGPHGSSSVKPQRLSSTCSHPTEGKYEDLFDGMYKKDIIRENMDRQNSLTRDWSRSRSGNNDATTWGKDRNPAGSPASREQRKSPEGQQNVDRIRHIWRRNNRNDSQATGWDETQKPQPHTNAYGKRQTNQGIRAIYRHKQTWKRKIADRIR